MHVQPLHQFRVTVAQLLQKQHGWAGAAGYQLAEKYRDLIEQCWNEYEFAEATASFVHNTHMRRPVEKFSYPTMASMSAVGCKFHKA